MWSPDQQPHYLGTSQKCMFGGAHPLNLLNHKFSDTRVVTVLRSFQMILMYKNLTMVQGNVMGLQPGLRTYQEKAIAPHSSTLAWKIPWMEETGRLRSMGSHRFGHSLSDLAVAAVVKEPSCQCRLETGSIPGSGRSPGRGQGNPLQYSCLENPMDRGAWQAAVHRVIQSDTSKATQHAHTQGQ